MRKYLELFINGFDETINEKTKLKNKPYIGYSPSEGLVFTEVPKPGVNDPWVTFTAEEDGSSIGLTKLGTGQTLEYSMDTTTWNTFDTTTNITLNNGDKVYVRGVLSYDNASYSNTQFKMSGKIAASGNCNAIWNYEDLTAPLKKYCGYFMFSGCTSLTAAPELPATELAESCYQYMFWGTSITTAPKLPATTLAECCYTYMFDECTSLTTAPELPATTLANGCYGGMFYGCTSLTTVPKILPATVLTNSCYTYMFSGCTSLTAAPELPATMLTYKCYQ